MSYFVIQYSSIDFIDNNNNNNNNWLHNDLFSSYAGKLFSRLYDIIIIDLLKWVTINNNNNNHVQPERDLTV